MAEAHKDVQQSSPPGRRRGTTTSDFGSGARENHDATPFYQRFRAPELSTDDTVLDPLPVPEPFICGDARHMDQIADGSVALVVTSPPYFAGKQYENELQRDGIPSSYLEYLQMLTDVFAECVRKLEPGGRIAVNVANLGRKPYRSLSADVIGILERDLGLLLRGELIWQKAEGATGSCAWGSFRSAANPVLRDLTERVIVASKGRFDRARTVRQRAAAGLPHRNTLPSEDFLALTLDVWSIPPESARRVGHPAPFPVELPEQLIRLYTFEDDLVLDPFMGSGSALLAAAALNRRFVGYDLDPAYVELSRRRVEAFQAGPPPPQPQPLTNTGTTATATANNSNHPDRPDAVEPVGPAEDRTSLASTKLAEASLVEAGFQIVKRNKRLRRSGVTVSFEALDGDGGTWLFDVCGANTSHRGGLTRSDVVWRSLGRCAAAGPARGSTPLVLLSSHLPRRGTEAHTALHAAGSPAFFDAIGLLDSDGLDRLSRYAKGSQRRPLAGFWSLKELQTP
ncbi:MAG: DNA-methyltransferase [Acidimicrobiales bacterium]